MMRRRLLWTALAGAALGAPAAIGGFRAGQAVRPAPTLQVTFLDVGQGDAALIRTPSGRALLVDAGRADRAHSRGRTVVLPYLRSRGLHTLDALVLTHWDQDHAGGADAVLNGIAVPRLLLPAPSRGREAPTETEKDTLRTARRTRARVIQLQQGQTIRTGDAVEVAVLNPPARRPRIERTSDNNGSLVLRVTFGRRRLLLMGDAEAEAEQSMLRSGLDLRADVLRVGHHGSASGTTDRWLDAVRPSHAVITVGARNPFGHPSPLVLRRLARRRIKTYRTDQAGAVTVDTDGANLRIQTKIRAASDQRAVHVR